MVEKENEEEEEVKEEGKKVHASPQKGGEVRGRVMMKENIEVALSLNIDCSV